MKVHLSFDVTADDQATMTEAIEARLAAFGSDSVHWRVEVHARPIVTSTMAGDETVVGWQADVDAWRETSGAAG